MFKIFRYAYYALAYILSLLYIYCSIFYVIYYFVKKHIRKPSTVWNWSKKVEHRKPECLKSDFWQHDYVMIYDNNVRIHYVEAGDKNKPLMLFIHGFPEFWYSWRHQIKEFSSDYWCVAIDLPGYNESEKLKEKCFYTMDVLVEHIKEIVTKLGRKRFTMVAHDWGGAIAWHFLDTYTDMVEKYVILNGTHTVEYVKTFQSCFEQFYKSWYIFFFQIPHFPEIAIKYNDFELFDKIFEGPEQFITKEDINAFKYVFSQEDALVIPINYYRANFFNVITVEDRIPPRNVPPGLLIFGIPDSAMSKRLADELEKSYHNLEVCIIKNSSHFVQQYSARLVNNQMREFLIRNSSHNEVK